MTLTDPKQITAEWLTAVLHTYGHLPHGSVVAVHHEGNVGLMSAVARLHVTYSADAPATLPTRLFLKYARAQEDVDLSSVGQQEVAFYTKLAPNMPHPPLVPCLAATSNLWTGQFLVLLEDLSATHYTYPLSQLPPSDAECTLMIDALAQFHAYWWDHPRLGVDVGDLPSEASVHGFSHWAEQNYAALATFLGDRLSAGRRQLYEQVLATLPPMLRARMLNGTHRTVFHGDFHVGNVLLPCAPHTATPRLIDWDGWGVDLGVSDLACLMALTWFPERRARLEQPLLRHYHAQLGAYGVQQYTWDDCWYDYRLWVLCALFIPAGQWAMHLPTDQWWNHFERIMLAAQDLDCMELLA